MKINKLLVFLAVMAIFSACKKQDENPIISQPVSSSSDHQVIVSNEGPFQSGTGTLSIINLSLESVSNHVFQNANSFPLGNIVQSAYRHDNRMFIVVTNASKVEVTDFPAMNSVATISGLSAPRYFISHFNTGYISDWGSGSVHVVDLENHMVSSEIMTGAGPDRMAIHNDQLLVLNSGGYNYDNRLSVINATQQIVIEQITVGDHPNSVLTDASGNVRVMCRGVGSWPNPEAETAGSLWVLDGTTFDVIQSFSFGEVSQHPSDLVSSGAGSQFYFLMGGDIYQMGIDDDVLPDTPLITGNFYSLEFHSGANVILATDALDFQQNGKVHAFHPDGTESTVFNVGVIPGHLLAL